MNEAVVVSTIEDTKKKGIGKAIKLYSYYFIKRTFDLICVILGFIFLIPIALIVKIAYMCTGDFKSIFFSEKKLEKY